MRDFEKDFEVLVWKFKQLRPPYPMALNSNMALGLIYVGWLAEDIKKAEAPEKRADLALEYNRAHSAVAWAIDECLREQSRQCYKMSTNRHKTVESLMLEQ